MERVHAVSVLDLGNMPGMTSMVAFPGEFINHSSTMVLKAKAEQGVRIYGILPSMRTDYLEDLFKIRCAFVVLSYKGLFSSIEKFVKKILANEMTPIIIVRTVEEYNNVNCAFGQEVIIGFSKDKRPEFLNYLIRSRTLNLIREHYFVGLDNPAEMAWYRKDYIFKVQHAFTGLITARCYQDSLFGIQYSASDGVFETVSEDFDMKLLMGKKYKHYQQYSLFECNNQTLKGFCEGKLGESFYKSCKEKLEEGNYEFG